MSKPRGLLLSGLSAHAETPAADAYASCLAACKERPRLGIHAFHRWFGKLIPAIPAAAIDSYTKPGELVLDPFCGSGTVLVEALASGRAAAGCDVNPLAALLARVKSRPIEPALLQGAALRVLARFEEDRGDDWQERAPAFTNRDHYYPPAVARDLVRLFAAARAEPELPQREVMLALVSAINRDVSNADRHHVFAGVSKAMRAKIAEGWIGDVPRSFERALRKRLKACAEFHERAKGSPVAQVWTCEAAELPAAPGSASLVVTNPPYVSSIRYVETFKLEAFWLGTCRDREELWALDRCTLGTERVDDRKQPASDAEIAALSASAGREAALALREKGEHAMSRVVLAYFAGLDPALGAAARALRRKGHAVVKIGRSTLRGVSIATPEGIAEILDGHGLSLIGAIEDGYNPASRSLTTARNWYSGRLDADLVLVFRKR